MRTQLEIKKIVNQLDKKAREHQRKLDIIERIKYLIKVDNQKSINTLNTQTKENFEII